jgi:hypothetical protein
MKKVLVLSFILMSAFLIISQNIFSDETVTFSSTQRQTQLLEIFSSQGCSSCPPAQNWVNRFEKNPDLWNTVIPVVYHVDYWDYIGWKDRFGKREFSNRQRMYKSNGNVKSVYTPGFVLNGKEWRGFFSRENLPESLKKTGTLTGTLIVESTPEKIRATYGKPQPGLKLNLAILGFGFETDVKNGENRNRKLDENFTVVGFAAADSNSGSWEIEIPVLTKIKAERYAAAVWVEKESTVIQATGGWFPNGFFN